jgi:HlyD family secretion protein
LIGAPLLLATVTALVAFRPAARDERLSGAIAPAPPAPARVAALGRLEPRDGVLTLAGPARPSAVVARLLVEEGDWVEAEAPLAVLEAHDADAAQVERARAILVAAEADLARVERLVRERVEATALRDDARRRVAVARAELALTRVILDLDTVRAPRRGQILVVHAREGERIGPEGLLDLGATDAMYAVAEVYETDVGRLRPGLRAEVRSPVFARPLGGMVERVGRMVRRQDVLDEDPVARVDARVVEVRVRLDPADGATVAGLSNLRVDVVIEEAAS